MLVYIGMNLFWTYQINNQVTGHLEGFGGSLGHIYIYAIGNLFKYDIQKYKLIFCIKK